MSFLEKIIVEGNMGEARLMSRFGGKLVREVTNLSFDELNMLRTYILGYYAVQQSGDFVDYQKLPYWNILKLIPPVPDVVNGAIITERIGRELIDETSDLEHIFRAGGISLRKNLRNLANLLSGAMAVADEKVSEARYQEIRLKLSGIVKTWHQRPENQTE